MRRSRLYMMLSIFIRLSRELSLCGELGALLESGACNGEPAGSGSCLDNGLVFEGERGCGGGRLSPWKTGSGRCSHPSAGDSGRDR